MNTLENICLSCGLCCDGSLIGFVQLNNDELPTLRELMEIEEINDKGFFLQPCTNFCDGCNIYSNRPKQCINFNCGLLKSVEQKEIDFNSATEIITLVKQKKVLIEQKLVIHEIELKSKSFYFKMVELKKMLHKLNADSSLTKAHLELISELKQLDSLLLKKFGITLN